MWATIWVLILSGSNCIIIRGYIQSKQKNSVNRKIKCQEKFEKSFENKLNIELPDRGEEDKGLHLSCTSAMKPEVDEPC